jgi:hypothetical protein
MNCVPLVVTVTGDGLSELGAHKGQRVLDIIASFMKGLCLEAVLRCPEYPLELNRSPETFQQQLQVLIPIFVFLSDDQGVEAEGYRIVSK